MTPQITYLRMYVAIDFPTMTYSGRAKVGDLDTLIERATEVVPDVDPSTVALWLYATRAGRMTEAFTREVLAEQGLDNTEFSILVVLWFSPEPHRTTMKDLANAVVLSQPGTTRALQRAERQGRIRKIADPEDGRAVIIQLTGHGRHIVDKTMRLLLQRLGERISPRLTAAQALAVARADAGYVLALDGEREPE
jgi:DNA-binding MarR family transcriptional regulator